MSKTSVSKATSDEKKIRFKYIFNDDYNTKYANGAYGGVTPRGEITINFYCERQPLPNEQIYSVDESGKLGDAVNVSPDDLKTTFVRVVEQGVIIDVRTAKEIVEWLTGKIEVIEASKLKK